MTSRAEDLTEAQASPQAQVARVKPCTATLVLDSTTTPSPVTCLMVTPAPTKDAANTTCSSGSTR
jgi:hypothetical protein